MVEEAAGVADVVLVVQFASKGTPACSAFLHDTCTTLCLIVLKEVHKIGIR